MTNLEAATAQAIKALSVAVWNEAIEAAVKVIITEQTGDAMLASFQTDMREQVKALKR